MDAQFFQKLINEIINRQTNTYDVIYLYGNQHSINTMIDKIIEKCCDRRIIRTSGASFREETLKIALNGNRSMPDCDLYILEGIDEITGLEANEQRLYGILDWLMESGKQIILSGATPVKEIKKIAPRIRTQIDGGISFCIE